VPFYESAAATNVFVAGGTDGESREHSWTLPRVGHLGAASLRASSTRGRAARTGVPWLSKSGALCRSRFTTQGL